MENVKIVSASHAGEKERLERIKKIGLKAKFTDFAAALQNYYHWFLELSTSSVRYKENVQMVLDANDTQNCISFINDFVGIRPVVDYSTIKDACYDSEELGNGITREKYGEYPKSRVTSEELIHICTKANKNLFKPTGKRYTIHKRTMNYMPFVEPTCHYPFMKPKSDKEVISLREFVDDEGNKYAKYENSWYKVEPVSMLVDRENDIAITEDVIYAGLPYELYNIRRITNTSQNVSKYEELEDLLGDEAINRLKERQTHSLKGFINNVLLKDLIPSKVDLEELFDKEIEKEDNGLGELEADKYTTPIVPGEPFEPPYPGYPFGPNPFGPINPWSPGNPWVPYVNVTEERMQNQEDGPKLIYK